MKVISGTECEITQSNSKEVSLLNNNLKGENIVVQRPDQEEAFAVNEVRQFELSPTHSHYERIVLRARAVSNIVCPIGTKITILQK